MLYQPGDLAWIKPKGFVFKIVRWVTRGKFGHIGLIAGHIQDHTIIIEAGVSGVDATDLKWRHVRKEDYVVYRIDGIGNKSEKLVAECLDKVGLKYDFSAIKNWIISSTIFGKDKQMICSELIYRSLRKAKIIDDVLNPEKVSPHDLFKLLENRMALIEKKEF